jgi:hypothetical protein
MSEYITCPACGVPNAPQQKFCGECGTPLREGVTRPLTGGERAALEERARWAGRPPADSRTLVWPGGDPKRRPRLIQGLLLLFALLLIAGGVFSLSGLFISQAAAPPAPGIDPPAFVSPDTQATPSDFVLLERGHSAKLGPGVVITFTQMVIQPASDPQMCPTGVTVSWLFDIENTNPVPANLVGDPDSIMVVDSTGQIYPVSRQCGAKLGTSFTQPITVAAPYPQTAYIAADLHVLSAAAKYLDLYMLISGQQYAFRTPFP